jgi:hypothetical protein
VVDVANSRDRRTGNAIGIWTLIVTALVPLALISAKPLWWDQMHDWFSQPPATTPVVPIVPETPQTAADLPPPDETMQVPGSEDPHVQPALRAGAVLLGAPDLNAYCAQWDGRRAVLRYQNTWGLRCAFVEGVAGNRKGDQYISVTEACRLTFPGRDTVDHYTDYHDPASWGCYA